MRLVLPLAFVVLLLGGCDAGPTRADRGQPDSETTEDDVRDEEAAGEDTAPGWPERVYPEGRDERTDERPLPDGGPGKVSGTLGGSARLEGGCVWVDSGSGRYEVSWPEGYRAETEPVRLLRDGEVVAESGDRITVRGQIDADATTICQVGPLLKATTVEVDGR